MGETDGGGGGRKTRRVEWVLVKQRQPQTTNDKCKKTIELLRAGPTNVRAVVWEERPCLPDAFDSEERRAWRVLMMGRG